MQLLVDGPAGLKGQVQTHKLATTTAILYPLVNPHLGTKCGLEFWAAHTKKLRSIVVGLHDHARLPVYVIHAGWEAGTDPAVFTDGLDLARIHGVGTCVEVMFVPYGAANPSKKPRV
jgi:hypothetical protein